MSKKYNQLKSRERFDLWRYIDDNRGSVAHDTDAETSRKATETLGFPVSEANIVAAREGLNIKKSGGRPASTKLAELESRISALELIVQEFTARAYVAQRGTR